MDSFFSNVRLLDILIKWKYHLLAVAVAAVLLSALLVLENFKLVIFDSSFYSYEFEKNKVDVPNANAIASDLQNYLKYPGATLQTDFSDREKLHLADVQGLVQKLKLTISAISIFVLLCFAFLLFFDRKAFLKNFIDILLYSSVISLTVLLISSLMFINFTSSFTAFHQMFFTNDLYILPANALLIRLFPEQFFVDVAIRIVKGIGLIALLGLGISVWYKLANRNKTF